jgi:CheY-like chemotaxis protein
MKLARTSIRVNKLVNEAYEQMAKEKDIRDRELLQIRVNIPEDTEPIIVSDKSRIRQVFNNLLSNAMKFTSEGYIEIGYEIQDGFVCFYVKDTGIGIDQDKLEIIFERFRQADDNLSRKYGGTGLGLAISRQIVELLGGRIWAESEPGHSSTFRFTIALKELDEKQTGLPGMSEISALQDLNLENRKILVAEDDPSNYLFIESLLGKCKAKLAWARDGKQAVEIYRNSEDFDLILMDIRMPVMNGLKATEKIRSKDQKIPIIALTAFAFADDQVKSAEAGCNEHLTKPVRIEDLKYVLHKYLVDVKA